MKGLQVLILLFFSTFILAQSRNVELLGNWNELNPSEQISSLRYNEVWGYADDTGEYAIIGGKDRIVFIDVTDPTSPQEVDEYFPGGNSTWRDFKTYSHYAYACTETTEGLVIFDLQYLPDSVHVVYQSTEFFSRSHNIFIDTATAKLYTSGARISSGSYRHIIILDLTDPEDPEELYSGNLEGGYHHDIYVRNDTAYVSHGSGSLSSNEYLIHDCTDPNDIKRLGGLFSYPQEGYNHASWVNEDRTHLVFADETHNRSLKMVEITEDQTQDPDEVIQLDITDLFRSKLLEKENGDTASIAHNPFIKGDSVYISYYHDGLAVFNISDPNNVELVAYYDTHPENTNYNGFKGAWGCYPYLPSGNILISDVYRGLYILKLMPCGQTNSWIGASSGNWNDSPDNWSLGQIPGPCDNVLIGFGNTIHVLDDECALGETLTISTGSILEVDDGAIMQIKYPN